MASSRNHKEPLRRTWIWRSSINGNMREHSMKIEKKSAFDHTGSTFDSFLEDEGILDEVQAVAIKRVIAWQIAEAMKAGQISKKEMAERMGTSRSQLDRLLDPENSAVHLETLTR